MKGQKKMGRQFQKTSEQNYNPWKPPQLDKDKILVAYARQSTERQKKLYVQSREVQSKDLVEHAIFRIEWPEDRVQLCETDSGTSATLDIEDRDGLRGLLDRIESGEVKAVLVYQVDRLFRDKFLVNAGIFARTCAEHGVVLFTYFGQVFDFQHNNYHVDAFIQECRYAWQAYDSGMMKRMNELHSRQSRNGIYDGRRTPLGLMLDPKTSNFVPYEPWAEVTVYLFQRCQELNYDVWDLFQEVLREQGIYPPLSPLMEKFIKTGAKKLPNGWYTLTYSGLVMLLTNPTYIGYWTYHNEVVIKDHHKGIVDEALFWDVFNHVNYVDIEGNPLGREKRFHRKSTPGCPGLLKDIIKSVHSDEKVYVHYSRQRNQWTYRIHAQTHPHLKSCKVARCVVHMQAIDDIVAKRVLAVLENTEQFKDYQQRMKEVAKSQEARRKRLQRELTEIEGQLTGSLKTLQLPDIDDETRNELIEARKVLRQRKEAVLAELGGKQESALQRALEYKELLGEIRDKWNSGIFDLADKKLLIDKLAKSVTLQVLSSHFLLLSLEWTVAEPESIIIWRPYSGATEWTTQEDNILRENYPHTSTDELLNLLPSRIWTGIEHRAQRLKIERVTRHPRPERPDLSADDWRVIERYEYPISLLDRKQFTSMVKPSSFSLAASGLWMSCSRRSP
jgi:hypothetical protein